jgi:hypothetical protein
MSLERKVIGLKYANPKITDRECCVLLGIPDNSVNWNKATELFMDLFKDYVKH